jgi:PAS domain S-box-containing protein
VKIETKLLGTLLGMSLLVAVVGALAVNRQQAAAMVGATKEAEDVAHVVSFLLTSGSNRLAESSLQEIVTRLHQSQGRDVCLMDANQRIVADSIPEEIGQTYADDPKDEIGQTIKDRKVRTFVEKSAAYPMGIKQIVVPIESQSGSVIGAVVLEYTPLYNELIRLTLTTIYQVVVAAIASIVIALLIAWYMGHSIVWPLRQLTRAMTGFAAGRTDLPMPPRQKNEIGELAAAFSHMMTERQAAEEKLGCLRDDLEVRVLERTDELAQANDTLSAENRERKQAEKTLRETEERFRSYFELGLIGAAITSPSKGCLEVNDELCRILGYGRTELLQKTWDEMTHPDDLAHEMIRFDRVLAGEIDGYIMDKRFVRKDGRVIDATVSIGCVRRADRSIDYLIGLLQDITERKKSETALRQAEEKYRSIYENSNEGIFQSAPEGHLISANPALARILGYDSSEELVADWTDGETERYRRPGLRREFQELLEKWGQLKDFEYEVMRKDGSWIWISENARVVRDSAGMSAYYEGSAQDITARKRAEEELFQSRETLRGILDHIPQRVFWKDRDLVYQGCNHAFALDMGFSDTSEVLGRTDLDAVWKAMAEAYRAGDREVIDSDKGKASFEEPGIDATGRPRWLRTSKIPLHDWQGQVTGVLGTYEDVTEHKLAKLEIERLNADLERRVAERTADLVAVTAEAERANRAKSEFLSRTSHELRTPMNAILGFGQLLEMEDALGPEPRESVEQILSAGRHLLTLIDKVLDISNAESGSILLSPQPLVVDQLLREILSLVRPLCARLHIQLDLPPSPDGDWMVLADPQRLKQVLLNLLANAIKYNRPNGTVKVRCVLMQAAVPAAIRFFVEDSGPGISAANLERLFTPFSRLDAERKQPHVAGTGLGLSLCKRLIELMGGALGVESVVGKGTMFWIDVPQATHAGKNSPGAAEGGKKRKKISGRL